MSRKKDPEQDFARQLSRRYGVPVVNLEDLDVERGALDLVPGELADRHRLLPISVSGGKLVVATADPSRVHALDDVKLHTGLDVEVCVAGPTALRRAINRYYFPN